MLLGPFMEMAVQIVGAGESDSPTALDIAPSLVDATQEKLLELVPPRVKIHLLCLQIATLLPLALKLHLQ